MTVVFAVLGVGLLLLGVWGARRREQLSVVPGYDERSIQRRSATLRRGAYACMAAGVLFLLLGVFSVVYRPTVPNCPPVTGPCTPECAAQRLCALPPAVR